MSTYKISKHRGYDLLEYEDDANLHLLQKNQNWMPHETKNLCPFKPDQILKVKANGPLNLRGINAVIVTRTRSFKYFKSQKPINQIEILGLPLRWFHYGHFEE